MLKRIQITALFAVLLLASGHSAFAEAIRTFDAVVKLQKNAALDVTETIVMDFGKARRHGIYRTISIENTNTHKVDKNKIKVLGIVDQNKKAIPYKLFFMGKRLRIRMGDPNTLITGVHTYCLHYKVSDEVNRSKRKPEIYWEVTGNDWTFNIKHTKVSFYPPENLAIDSVKFQCFQGSIRNRKKLIAKKHKSYFYSSAGLLIPGEGITIKVQLPHKQASTSQTK